MHNKSRSRTTFLIHMPQSKDWDAILRDLSSGEDSDAHDELNVRSVQKNAHRVAEMVRTVVPGLGGAASFPGMNRPDVMRAGLADAIGAASPRSRDPSAAPPSKEEACEKEVVVDAKEAKKAQDAPAETPHASPASSEEGAGPT